MSQSTTVSNGDANGGLLPAETQQVLNSLIAGLEDLGDALTYLLPLFRSLACHNSRYSAQEINLALSGGDVDLVRFIHDRWAGPDPNPAEVVELLGVLVRSLSFREQAELQQRKESRDKHTIPVTWQSDRPLPQPLAATDGDVQMAEIAIYKAQHAQVLLLRAKAILERAVGETAAAASE